MKRHLNKQIVAIIMMAMFCFVTTKSADAAENMTMKDTLSVEKGHTYNLNISGKKENEKVTWKSGKTSVATVDQRGVVTGKKV